MEMSADVVCLYIIYLTPSPCACALRCACSSAHATAVAHSTGDSSEPFVRYTEGDDDSEGKDDSARSAAVVVVVVGMIGQ